MDLEFAVEDTYKVLMEQQSGDFTRVNLSTGERSLMDPCLVKSWIREELELQRKRNG